MVGLTRQVQREAKDCYCQGISARFTVLAKFVKDTLNWPKIRKVIIILDDKEKEKRMTFMRLKIMFHQSLQPYSPEFPLIEGTRTASHPRPGV